MLGTKRLVELCHRMINLEVCTLRTIYDISLYTEQKFVYTLQALVHISTAYCNCDRTEINETIYSTPYDPANIINLTSWLPEDLLDKVWSSLECRPALLQNSPNTLPQFLLSVDTIANWKTPEYVYVYKSAHRTNATWRSRETASGNCSPFNRYVPFESITIWVGFFVQCIAHKLWSYLDIQNCSDFLL